MAIAIFNDQDTLAGQKLGISTAKALALTVMACGLAAMNIYHMGNAVTSKLLTPESSIFAYALLYFIACCIAFMEVPVTEEIVTQNARGKKALGHRLMLAVIVIMAIGAGLYSITSDASKRETTVTAHETAGLSYQDNAQALISDRNIARANATTTAERSKANADYYRALAALHLEQSEHQSSRPALAVKTDSVFHWVWAIGFSLLCSLGVVVITAYLTKYHKPLTEIPRVFFKVREDQAWTMNDDDVRVIPASVDLTGGGSTSAARKQLARPSSSENSSLTSSNSRAIDKRPHGLYTTQGGHNCASERSLNNDSGKGEKKKYSQDHYEAIKRAILTKDIKPVQKAVKTRLVALQVRFVDDGARQQKAVEILAQLKSEGAIVDNPKQGQTNKILAQYIVNPDYSQPKQGTNDVEATCTECGEVGLIDRSVLQKSGGRLRGSCGHVYRVPESGWKIKPAVGLGIGISEEGISPIAGIGALISK